MTPSQAKEAYIDNYCQEKGYQVVKTEVPNGTKLEISNLSEKIPLVLYSSGSIVPQGSPNSLLRKEFDLTQKYGGNYYKILYPEI